MKLTKQLILVFLVFILQSKLFAQQNRGVPYKRCSVKTLNFELGLLNNATTNIITDANGFTWVSTYTGMQRYNGYTLEQINPVINNATIEINYPVFFFGLSDGKIWISYKQGVLEYSPFSHSFKEIIQISLSKSFFSIVPLKETSDGIWCIQENKGIVVYNRTGVIYKQVDSMNHAIINNIIQSQNILLNNIISSNNNFIYIRSSENSILRINIRNNQYNNLPFIDGAIYSVGCTADKLYVLSDKGLYSRSIYENYVFKNIFDSKTLREKINAGSISIAENNALFFSINRHFYEIDSSSFIPREFTSFNREPIVSTGAIFKIYPDKYKRIWLLTNNDIKRIQNVNIPFEHFIYTDEKNNFIRSIFYDEKKHLLIAGCYNGAIQLYDTLANPLLQKPMVNAAAGYILAIEKLAEDKYLLQTLGNGLFHLNLKTKKIQEYTSLLKQEFRNNNFENNMQRINDSTIFISTSKNVYRYILKNGKIVSANPLFTSFDISNQQIGCFIYGSDKILWAGTIGGLLCRLDNKGNFKTFNIPENYGVRSITETNDNGIWAGTNKGLYMYDSTGTFIKSFTTQTGLLNDCIYALLAAGSNAVFASSNLGLSYVNENGTIKNFTKELGLQENEFNTGAAIKTSSGKFFFGGVNGISAFYAASLSVTEDAPVLNITRFVVNDSMINPSTKIWRGDTITLNHNQNRLQFDFAALGLFNNNEYLYKYRLKGFEESWQSTHQPTAIKYNLAPGKYTLEIVCSPVLSSNSIFKKNIAIIIKPPWWQTWWFSLLAVIATAGIIALIAAQYNRRKYLQKIRALQLQYQLQIERERISRELHDNIGAQLSFISSNIDWVIDRNEDLPKEQELQQMKAINETAKNVMSNLRETIWALHKEAITLNEFSDKLKVYIQNVIRLKPDIKFRSEENIIKNIVFTPAETLNIFRICQEIINNVIKHAEATLLKLLIYSDEKSFSILIEDNGKGFNQSEKLNGHYGLENIKFRAKELNASLIIKTEPAKGTSVSITK